MTPGLVAGFASPQENAALDAVMSSMLSDNYWCCAAMEVPLKQQAFWYEAPRPLKGEVHGHGVAVPAYTAVNGVWAKSGAACWGRAASVSSGPRPRVSCSAAFRRRLPAVDSGALPRA
jgi:hypothetical protein